MNKIKLSALAAFAVVVSLLFASCSRIADGQLAAFEKSITKLEQNYKDLTPDQLERSINLCEKQLDKLNENTKLTKAQQKKLSNLTGRYHKVLIKIKAYLLINELFDTTEVESLIEYIGGLLGDLDIDGLLDDLF